MWFANIFSPSVGCFLILLMICFGVQKILSLMQPHLLIFPFAPFAFSFKSKKVIAKINVKQLTPKVKVLLGILLFQVLMFKSSPTLN